VTRQQRDALDQRLRDVPLDLGGFAAMLDEADAALTSAGEFLRAHLA
jgi:hypothetical protein